MSTAWIDVTGRQDLPFSTLLLAVLWILCRRVLIKLFQSPPEEGFCCDNK